MVNYADVMISNCGIEKGKKDPNKEYLKVLCIQGLSAVVLNAPNEEVYRKCESAIGQDVRLKLEWKPEYQNMTLVDISLL